MGGRLETARDIAEMYFVKGMKPHDVNRSTQLLLANGYITSSKRNRIRDFFWHLYFVQEEIPGMTDSQGHPITRYVPRNPQ